mmetsp:Transcript_3242/g.6314  ORF Transcript_3242/g.6314 Transcript_3242/m.6314 type:complete len:103 (+) Transcript_3242:396-704(+)
MASGQPSCYIGEDFPIRRMLDVARNRQTRILYDLLLTVMCGSNLMRKGAGKHDELALNGVKEVLLVKGWIGPSWISKNNGATPRWKPNVVDRRNDRIFMNVG